MLQQFVLVHRITARDCDSLPAVVAVKGDFQPFGPLAQVLDFLRYEKRRRCDLYDLRSRGSQYGMPQPRHV